MPRLAIFLAGLGLFGMCAMAHAVERPNIVFILADDMGYGDMSCQNPKSKIPTPNLDRLASQGMRFTDAHAATAVCTPSRYAILTGRYCWRSRLKTGVLLPFDPPLVEPGRLTVAAMLDNIGYSTAMFGKWHLGFDWPTKDGKRATRTGTNAVFDKPIPGGPYSRGFQYYFGVDIPNYPPYVFIENDRAQGIPVFPKRPGSEGRPGPMLPGWDFVQVLPTLTDRACNYIEKAGKESSKKPFFLYFPMTAPHYPIVPAPQFHNASKAGDYGDFVCEVDWAVGRVMEALDKSGLANNTLVFFTSDNGPEVVAEVRIGAYDRILKYDHFSMGDWRGCKRDAWEGGHREPFLVRWPNHVPAGTINNETICNVDLMATAAAITGASASSAGEDSYNILPLLLGQKSAHPIRPATVLVSMKGKYGLRQGDWMFIDAPTGDDNHEPEWFKQLRHYEPDNQPKELYDLRQDPAEHHNVYREHTQMAQEMLSLLEKYKREGRSTGPMNSQRASQNDGYDLYARWGDVAAQPILVTDVRNLFGLPVRPPEMDDHSPIIGAPDDN